MLTDYISIPVFLLSFFVGIFFVYILGPETKQIFIYPSPEIIQNVLIKDKADNCFSFKQNEISCPKFESQIFNVPIQT